MLTGLDWTLQDRVSVRACSCFCPMDYFFRYVLLHRMGLSQRPYWLLPVGLGFGMLQLPVPNDLPLTVLPGPFLE